MLIGHAVIIARCHTATDTAYGRRINDLEDWQQQSVQSSR